MNARFLWIAAIALCTLDYSWAEDATLTQKETRAGTPHAYPQIGLEIRVSDWPAEIDDQTGMWLLLGYPLVEHPVADVQYRVVISSRKCTEAQHLRWYPRSSTNSTEWINLQHLQTSLMTNAFWICFRRDVFASNGYAYFCEGRIKRDPHLAPKDPGRLDPGELELASEVSRILDSITVIATNSTKIQK